MTARPGPPTRIGEAERAEAQRALQHHLNVGRLQVAEFVERFAGAADAVTAADVAALFADLPAPHPKLPGSPLAHTRRKLVIVGAVAVAVVALVGLLGFVIGRGQTTLASSGADAAPTPASVRRTTGPGSITLPRRIRSGQCSVGR